MRSKKVMDKEDNTSQIIWSTLVIIAVVVIIVLGCVFSSGSVKDETTRQACNEEIYIQEGKYDTNDLSGLDMHRIYVMDCGSDLRMAQYVIKDLRCDPPQVAKISVFRVKLDGKAVRVTVSPAYDIEGRVITRGINKTLAIRGVRRVGENSYEIETGESVIRLMKGADGKNDCRVDCGDFVIWTRSGVNVADLWYNTIKK